MPTKLPALYCRTTGEVDLVIIPNYQAMAGMVGCEYTEMHSLGKFPINHNRLNQQAQQTIRASLLPYLESRIDALIKHKPSITKEHALIRASFQIQLFVHEYGALIRSEVNPAFDHGPQCRLRGDVILLLGHCDDLPYGEEDE